MNKRWVPKAKVHERWTGWSLPCQARHATKKLKVFVVGGNQPEVQKQLKPSSSSWCYHLAFLSLVIMKWSYDDPSPKGFK